MGTSDANDLDGLKVMVIDDSKTIRRTAETLLKKSGCDVVTATDGFEALSKILEHRPNMGEIKSYIKNPIRKNCMTS